MFHPELKAPCHMIEILEADPNKTQQWEFVNSVIFCLTIVTTIGKLLLVLCYVTLLFLKHLEMVVDLGFI